MDVLTNELAALRATFYAEARDMLDVLDGGLRQLDPAEPDPEVVNAIFRTVHTIKGSAGMFEIESVVGFAHGVESVLQKVRDGSVAPTEPLIGVLLECHDLLEDMIAVLESGAEVDDAVRASGMALVARLNGVAGIQPAGVAVMAAGLSGQTDANLPAAVGEVVDGESVESDTWHISIRFHPDVFEHGFDPASFLRFVATLGDKMYVTTIDDRLPTPDSMDPRLCYLGFEIELHAAVTKQEIESAFDFVIDDCDLRILPPHSKIAEYVSLIRSLPEESARIGQILVAAGALTARELSVALAYQARGEHTQSALGEILIEAGMARPAVVEAALGKQRAVKDAKSGAGEAHVRVSARKLDALIDLVGELVIAGSSALSLAKRSKDRKMRETNAAVARLVEDIRDHALKLRMVEIGDTFNRFHRVVRETARNLGKDIELSINGAETELDKTVVEKIGDPLVHLVRNAIDHGIESVEKRAELGKPARGRILLNAFHDSGAIVIEVADDGAGLSRSRILKKAGERGLVSSGQAMSDREVYELLFAPGFSTAEKVSDLSGRGVGLDVVKRSIEALRGQIDIRTESGRGTVFSLRLPLTLAIIEGFLVSSAGAYFVMPMDVVVECIDIGPRNNRGDYVDLRGSVLPYIRLREFLQLEGPPCRRESIVVVRAGARRLGVVVEQLHGELQTVIKPLGVMFQSLRGVSGTTILGSGEIALIIDIPALLRQAEAIDHYAMSNAVANAAEVQEMH